MWGYLTWTLLSIVILAQTLHPPSFGAVPLAILEFEIEDRLDDLFLLCARQDVMKRQADQLVANALGDRAITLTSAKAAAHV